MDQDVQGIWYIGMEVHLQLKEKAAQLMEYLEKFFVPLKKAQHGHWSVTYKNRTV